MNKEKVLIAAAGIVALGVAIGLEITDGSQVIVGMQLRQPDGGYEYVEKVMTATESRQVIDTKGGDVAGELRIRLCDSDKTFCDKGGERSVAPPCVIPVDKTCLRQYPGSAKPEWRGFNVMPASESSGNCQPVPCALMAGDEYPGIEQPPLKRWSPR